MAGSIKPPAAFLPSRAAITEKDGMATFGFQQILLTWQRQLQNGLDSIGQLIGNINPDSKIVPRPEGIGTTVQYLDDEGVVLPDGVDFDRPYLHKDTDHITDGIGSPLAGGRVAYAAMVASLPTAGQGLRYDGTFWLPGGLPLDTPVVATKFFAGFNAVTGAFNDIQPAYTDISGTPILASTYTAPAHQFVTGYDDTTGIFASAQPAFTDISGQITTAQLPPSGISATIVTASLTAGGTQGSMTFVNGILTAQTPAT